jgi:hypothetical protein
MLGGLGGGAIAPYAGASPAAGHLAGRTLAASISKWLGFGAYKVGRNSIMQESDGTIPMMHRESQSVVVRHREYLGDVKSSINYTKALELALNPGLASSFPWLSTMAQMYQEYTWRGMVFHFVPTVGEAVSSTVPAFGNVMMHTDYRVTAPAPVSKAELLNEYFASDARPSEAFIHPIECDPKENPYNVQYVRTNGVSAYEDPKSYDLGMFRVYTQGQSADNVTLGEIWVTYEVELRKPQVASTSSGYSWFDWSGTTSTTLTFGTTQAVAYNGLGISTASGAGYGTVYLPNLYGLYMITVAWSPSAAMTLAGITSYATDCLTQAAWGPTGGDLSVIAQPTALSTSGVDLIVVLCSGKPTAKVQYSLSTCTNCQGSNVVVTRMTLT